MTVNGVTQLSEAFGFSVMKCLFASMDEAIEFRCHPRGVLNRTEYLTSTFSIHSISTVVESE